MNIREETQLLEHRFFSEFASFSDETRGKDRQEADDDLRTPYQRDRDRIIHSKAFRRLKHKTQVFLAPEGDHYRTRLTHTLEVSQIARTISRSLRLNEDLTEAIALGHDLGHTPFGHAGERALDSIMQGGFKHYEQSVRVVEKLEKDGEGLNLTYEVKNGMLCHTCGQEADTPEGRIIRWADKIAYMNHDIDDAIRAGVIVEKDIPEEITAKLGNTKSKRISTLIHSVIAASSGGDISMQPEIFSAYEALADYMFNSVYTNEYAKKEEKKVPHIVASLFDYFLDADRLPASFRLIAEKEGPATAACDIVAGMTDNYAVECFKSIFIPKAWNIEL